MSEKATTRSIVQLDRGNLKRIRDVGIAIILLVIVVYSFNVSQVDPINLINGFGYTWQLLEKMYPPDTVSLPLYLSLIEDTIAMGV
ncbi:MAG TPA: hypothetical protein VK436_14505, partial [Methanocella sp.]|nr:hypothetical protein [Methanocella sp.]